MMKHYNGLFVFLQRNTSYLVALLKIVNLTSFRYKLQPEVLREKDGTPLHIRKEVVKGQIGSMDSTFQFSDR